MFLTHITERLDGQLELAAKCWGFDVVDNAGEGGRARRGRASPAREGDPGTTRRTGVSLAVPYCVTYVFVCVSAVLEESPTI